MPRYYFTSRRKKNTMKLGKITEYNSEGLQMGFLSLISSLFGAVGIAFAYIELYVPALIMALWLPVLIYATTFSNRKITYYEK